MGMGMSTVCCIILVFDMGFLWLLQVRLTFDEPESGVTIVKLIHTDVPEEDRLVSIYMQILPSLFPERLFCCTLID